MSVHRHSGARWNTSIENPDPIVLEKDRVEPRRSDHGVKVIRATATSRACRSRSKIGPFGWSSPFDDTPRAFCRAL